MSLKSRLARIRTRLAREHKKDHTLHDRIAADQEKIRETKKAIVRHRRPMRLRAYDEAQKLVGVMELGGNNRGPQVEAIIHENGGATGEPWCGDFVAHCYRTAGSTAVDRSWASVELLGHDSGVVSTPSPLAGDLVRFTFDHVGMFVRDNGNGTITTIEGNTGAVGAQSDSKTGGDGVYRKTRSKSLVRDYLSVKK